MARYWGMTRHRLGGLINGRRWEVGCGGSCGPPTEPGPAQGHIERQFVMKNFCSISVCPEGKEAAVDVYLT